VIGGSLLGWGGGGRKLGKGLDKSLEVNQTGGSHSDPAVTRPGFKSAHENRGFGSQKRVLTFHKDDGEGEKKMNCREIDGGRWLKGGGGLNHGM